MAEINMRDAETGEEKIMNLHLVCNAHVDPVWLWDMEEGISAALSTFRMAAVFCEEYGGFVFNHNEVVLYEWIQEMEPQLFERIKKLVKEGKWNIMGGWYLQPDCNMPNGESFIRQMETGREYFQREFGITPSTAINFDPFGHSRGLVQLIAKAGYDSYLFCRPGQGDCPLPADDFVWVGFDGSKIMGHRADTYGTLLGETDKKIQEWLDGHGKNDNLNVGCMLWGVGNHGGGPSRIDLDAIAKRMNGENQGWKILHSTPEKYFAERKQIAQEKGIQEPEVKMDLNSWAVGCYTSQIRIKQKHRELEGNLAMTEKMLSQAVLAGVMEYPEEAMKEVQKTLLFSEFHDILPGTSIQSAEERSLQMLDYGLELAAKWKSRAFFAMLAGETKAEEGEYPILVYNPHPYEVEGDFVCEFQLANQNWTEKVSVPVVYQKGKEIPSQVEKEGCNLNLDWRKKVAFHGTLKPASMNRFSGKVMMVDEKPERKWNCTEAKDGKILFDNGKLHAEINCSTGLLDSYRIDGKEYVQENAASLVVLKTDCDPWGMNRHSYREEVGRFQLLDDREGSIYSGVWNERHAGEGKEIPSVRIIEEGPVRTVVEAVFGYQRSRACMKYTLPVAGESIELQLRVDWAEKGRFLKLEIPTRMQEGIPYSETAYGVNRQKADGEEKVFQRWCGIWEEEKDQALTVINRGNYGVDFLDGVMRISLIHSAVYSAHPIGGRPLLEQDRFLPYIDQGERNFSFKIQAGNGKNRREQVTKDAIFYQEAPMAVQAFPAGEGEKPMPAARMESEEVVLSAWRKVSGEDAYLLRLYESAGEKRTVKLQLEGMKEPATICMKPYEVKTLKYSLQEKKLQECGIFGK